MVSIRRAKVEDLLLMQQTNLLCLPENYQFKYFMYHYLSWPSLLHVAEEYNGKIVGYVLAKLEDEEEANTIIHGHITSISVLRTYRKLGLASKLMTHALNMMKEYYDANLVSLHVRVSNRPALQLYKDNLGFEVLGIEKGYYADKEDAYVMKKFFKQNERDKEKDKIIQLTDDLKYEDIKDIFEEVDPNGEEKPAVEEEKKVVTTDNEKLVEEIEKISITSTASVDDSKKSKKKKGGKKKK